MLASFVSHIEKLCKTTDKILLAVSGGMDSMVMLQLFHQAGFSISVAHCNFQLRGNESDEDEKFVAATCEKWDIPFHSTRFDTNNYAIQHGLSIQMAARELRYRWFHQVKESETLDWIATAHHLNDSVETVLLNLIKGTSLDGLLGIAEKKGHVIRPLLFASQAEIQNYAAQASVAWREDESNQTDDYQRNFIRHQVIPKLKEVNPALELSIEKTGEKLAGDACLVYQAVEGWKKQFVAVEKDKTLFAKAGFDRSLGLSGNNTLLWRLLKKSGFHFDQCKSILLAMNGQPGKKFLSASHQLVVDRQHLILSALRADLQEVTTIEQGQRNAFLGNRKLTLTSTDTAVAIDPSRNMAMLDERLIRFPLTWRTWKPGDSFLPLGMANSKKISDLLIDQKVSMADKDLVTILESAGELVWVVGHRIADPFKITANTNRVLVIGLE